jgi:hypothetical protein
LSYEYRLVVQTNTTGGSKGNITKSDAIFSVDSFDLAPDGNCLEATFRAPPKALPFTIELRDVITIETRPDSVSAWTPRYRGYVTLAGNPRSDNVETYRLVGLKQRFFEVNIRTGSPQSTIIASADVATMANQVFLASGADIAFPGIVGVDYNTFDAPTLTFIGGRRITQLESAGNAFDALAGLVGQFIVPTGDTYTYDGETYSGGDVVPPVTWGVRANGEVFFRRDIGAAASIDETDLEVQVTYPALSGEEVVTSPIIVYYPGMDFSRAVRFQQRNLSTLVVTPLLPVWQPWSHRVQPPNASQRVVQLPNPDDYLLDALSEYTITGNTFTNPGNAYDGNPSTFASGVLNNFISFFRASPPFEIAPTALRIDAEFGDNIALQFRSAYRFSLSGQTISYEFWWEPVATAEAGGSNRLQVTFPVLLQTEFLALAQINNTTLTAELQSVEVIAGPNGSGGTAKVYDYRPFRHVVASDNVLANQLAESYRRSIVEEVANIKVFDDRPLHASILLTPETGSPITVPVARVQYSITTVEGVTTTYHAGQPFDGQLVSERVVLEGLARRAVGGM